MPFDYRSAARAFEVDPEWYENDAQLQEDIDARRQEREQKLGKSKAQSELAQVMRQWQAHDRNNNAPRVAGGGMADWRGEGLTQQAAMAAYGTHAAQGQMLGDMASDANDLVRKEMDRRVALSREMRRMQHERDLEQMRQDTERQKTEALLARLNQASGGYQQMAEGVYMR